MRIPHITPARLHPKHLSKVPHKKSLFVAANAAVRLRQGLPIVDGLVRAPRGGPVEVTFPFVFSSAR